MCQLQPRNNVTHGTNTRDIGAHPIVGQHKTAIHSHTEFFITAVSGCRTSTHCNEQQVRLNCLAIFQRHDNAICILRHTRELHANFEVDSALAKRTLKCLAQRFIFRGNQTGERFDDSHISAKRLPHRRKLNADDTATKDNDALRNVVKRQSLIRGDDATTNLKARKGTSV